MTRRHRSDSPARRAVACTCWVAVLGTLLSCGAALAADFPITAQQRDTARKVAQVGVPLSELAPPGRAAMGAGSHLT